MKIKTLVIGLMLPWAALWAQSWQLVWSDEFDGDSLDQSRWSYQTGTGTEYGLTDWGNNEMQYYKEENVVLDTGYLFILAKRENVENKQFTSGRIRTIDKGDWKYGRFEFRAKMPVGKGLWAAIWMLPTDEAYGGWAASGEIDIMEYLGEFPNTVHGTLHFGGSWPNNDYRGTDFELDSGDFHTSFHDFVLEWEEGEIRWYVDGEKYQTQDQGDWWTTGWDFPAPFDKRFHLLINLAVGGNWPGPPDMNTQFPQELVVDYVRVYEWNPYPAGMEGIEIPDDFRLDQNYPNPFEHTTTLSYTTSVAGQVILELFDPLGRKIHTVVDRHHDPGPYKVNLDGSVLLPGIYTCRMKAGSGIITRQMVRL